MRPPPQIARIITRLNVGGPARQALYLTRTMPSRGFPSELFAGTEGEREGTLAGSEDRVTRVRSLGRELRPLDDVRAWRALRHLIAERRPAIVHTHMAKAGALGRLSARHAGVPVVVHTFHGHVLEGYFSRPSEAAFIAVERRLAHGTDALIAVSEAIRDQLLALGIGRASQWRVIPVGLELSSLLLSSPDAARSRQRLGLPVEGRIVGIVGRLVPIKDHEIFLRAAVEVAALRPDVTFVVAGDGELRAALQQRAHAQLGNRVRFLGWVDDLPALYASLDVAVLTSRNEGTPVSLIEAGAAGRPVVATDVGGVAHVVRDALTGWLVPRSDPRGVASRLTDLLDDPVKAGSMGQAGREWIRDRFSAERLADDMEELYGELLERKASSRAANR